MVLWFIRALFILLIASMVFTGLTDQAAIEDGSGGSNLTNIIIACVIVITMGLSIDFLVKKKNLAGFSGIFFGLFIGLLLGLGFNKVIDFIYMTYSVNPEEDFGFSRGVITWVVNVLCCYLAIVFIMQTKDDFRFIIPYVEFSKQTKGLCPMILDTSVIIDGRIADIAATNILNAPLIAPRFVLNELQVIADSPDRLRRNRGRRGLDILNRMQTDDRLDLSIEDVRLTPRESSEPVDLQLVSTAIQMGGKIITNDYNLHKVAVLRGVDVININDLANALKPVVMPGESMTVKIVKSGDQPGQGVGYLDDGTMVVVENAKAHVTKLVNLIVTSVLQTSAGRMIFGKLDEKNPFATPKKSPDHSKESHNDGS